MAHDSHPMFATFLSHVPNSCLEVSLCSLYNGLLQILDFDLCWAKQRRRHASEERRKRVVFPTLGSNLIVAHHLCGMQQERLCARGCYVCGRPMRYFECNAMSYFSTPLRVIPRQSKLCISRLGWGGIDFSQPLSPSCFD